MNRTLEIKTGDTVEQIGQLEDLRHLLRHNNVVLIHGINFVVRWRKGALVLVPQKADDILVSLGVTRKQIEKASGNKIMHEAIRAWKALDMWPEEDEENATACLVETNGICNKD